MEPRRSGALQRSRQSIHVGGLTTDLIASGITGPIGTVGDAVDNALMESTIGLYKTEVIKPCRILGRPPRRRLGHRRMGPLVQQRPAPLQPGPPTPATYETHHYHHDQALNPEAA